MLQHMRVILILVLTLPLLISSTKLILTSNTSQSTSVAEIPLVHDHPFSCQLVFFNVHNNQLHANISGLPEQVKEVRLVLEGEEEEEGNRSVHFNSTSEIVLNSALFSIDLSSLKQDTNFETIMTFTLTYFQPTTSSIISHTSTKDSREQVIQQRKAYMLFCQNTSDYLVKLPIKTMVITQVIGLLFILVMPLNVQYRKFLPFTYNIFSVCIYAGVLFVGLYLHVFFGGTQTIYEIQKYVVGMFQLACLVLYSQDILALCIKVPKIAFITGLILSLILIIIDFFGPIIQDAWFLNDLISIMVAGAFIKFVIIRKFKTAVWALGIMWMFCLFREFAIQWRLQKFEQGLGYRVIPLFVQLPTKYFDNSSSIVCSAFGNTKIIGFGIILNYCKRIDLSLSTHFYFILTSITAIACIIIELLFNLFIMMDLPTSEVTSILLFYPISTLLILFYASKRGEMAEVWHGSFYDLAVNRSSIERNISFQKLEASFGKDLLTESDISVDAKLQKGRSGILEI